MLMDRRCASLLVVDVQERLLPAIADGAAVLDHCVWLVRVARELGVPVVRSEQYPRGLGPTATALQEAAGDAAVVYKTAFSCVADGSLSGTPVDARRQVVVTGTEAHVCVLQTALGLRWQGKEVFVVAEAVGSRKPADKELALARMRAHGIEVVSREMVAFEWMERCTAPEFRTVSRNFIR